LSSWRRMRLAVTRFLALCSGSPILVGEPDDRSRQTNDFAPERVDSDRLQKWLECLHSD